MVDNDAEERSVLSLALDTVDGVQAELFESGLEVLDRLEAGDVPDLLVLDLDFPEISAIEMLAEIRESNRTATLPVAILSADTDVARVDHAYRNGANVYFGKPDSVFGFALLFQHLYSFWDMAISPPASAQWPSQTEAQAH